MTIPDRVYYQRRAKAELRKANMTDDPTTRRVHLELADRYVEKVRFLLADATGKAA